MGSKVYAEALIGMTIPRAKRFVEENTVYFDENNTKYRISTFREIIPNGIYTMDYCPNRLSVKTENDVIVEILRMG